MYLNDYLKMTSATRPQRIQWWKEARFGMFIHLGLYTVLDDHEWSKGDQNYTDDEYNKLAHQFNVTKDSVEQWVLLAKNAGMKYIVLTTRHHEGFALWDSRVNPFNAVNYGCQFDIVQSFVSACRKHGMRIGFYFSLMDWHHPDASDCAYDLKARSRFLEYIQSMLKELMTNYGTIDILWYDIPRPMTSFEGWDTLSMNQMVRSLQPNIIINNRSRISEDFGTPEEHLNGGSFENWEACMTFNGLSWGYLSSPNIQYYNYNAQQIIRMLGKIASRNGNLLLNISPNHYGAIDTNVQQTLLSVGNWLATNGEAVYGKKNPATIYRANDLCLSSEHDNIAYIWNFIQPKNNILRLGGSFNQLLNVTTLLSNIQLPFEQTQHYLKIDLSNLKNSIIPLGILVLKLEFADTIQYKRATRYPQISQGNFF